MRRYFWLGLLGLPIALPSGCAESGDVIIPASETDEGMGGSSAGDGDGDGDQSVGGEGPIGSPCAAFSSGADVTLCAASYLGSSEDDQIIGVGYLSDARIVIGGNFPAELEEAPESVRAGAGPGGVVVLGNHGQTFERHAALSSALLAIAVDAPRARVVVVTESVVLALDEALEEEWSTDVSFTTTRADVGPDGKVALLDESGGIHVLSSDGALLFEMILTDPIVSDVALATDGDALFVVGAHDDPSLGCQGSVPFLRKLDTEGAVLARAYDFDDVDGNCASSVGRRVTRGRDGALYYAGENQGGNTVHLRDPQDVSAPAPLVSYDIYNQGYGMAIQRYGFVARFAEEDLSMDQGQLMLPRDDDETGGEFLIDEIMADGAGRVAVAARSTCCIPSRAALTVAGEPLGAYAEREVSVTLFSADFLERSLWMSTTMSSDAPVSDVSMGLWDGHLIVATSVAPGTTQSLFHPLIEQHLGGTDGYYFTLPTQ